MRHEFVGNSLHIVVDAEEQAALKRRMKREDGAFDSDITMSEVFEPLICNTELSWVLPEETGDLTSAPMLGILGEAEQGEVGVGYRHAGRTFEGTLRQRIIRRWAFMEYAFTSPQRVLAEMGRVSFSR